MRSAWHHHHVRWSRRGHRPFPRHLSGNPGRHQLGGAITGSIQDGSDVNHGFVRAPDGNITTFDVPGAGTGAFQGTIPANINNPEAIDGSYIDASDVVHGFVRAPDGSITTFDAAGAGTGPGQGTFPQGINDAGAITGYYIDNHDVLHGFLRTRTHRAR